MKTQSRNEKLGAWLPVVIAALATACSSGSPAPMACAPVEPSVIAEPGLLAGSYRVTAVATDGEMAGNSIGGNLTLVSTGATRTSSASGFRTAYRGYADLDFPAIGALRVGSLASRDSLQPGVVVQVRELDRGHEIVMRFGSEANRSDRQRVDGGYTAFFVQSVSHGSLAGRWQSGVTRTDAAGYFCAEPVPE